MKRAVCAALVLLVMGCAKKQEATAEQIYPMTATVISRDVAKNTLNLDNKEVPGRMAAMQMSYEVRGAKVRDLPPDGTPVVVTIHETNGAYYITDVKATK